MFPVRFTRPPEGSDRYGRPSFHMDQVKGLAAYQSDILMRGAGRATYLSWVDDTIFHVVARALRPHAGRPLDVFEVGGGDGHSIASPTRSVAT